MKTIGPLHFEDLEPHRFEDLVRQLIYSYKNWKNLEPTGRTGQDRGFDIRATEIMSTLHDEDIRSEYSSEEAPILTYRNWLIQCKREKSIEPKKLEQYLTGIIKSNNIDCLLFVASCDFSIKARDVFYKIMKNANLKEFHIWGKAELEDKLFQPENDHLLFAYFGISINVKKKALNSSFRTRLTNKKKVYNVFKDSLLWDNSHNEVLIIDPFNSNYPYEDENRFRNGWVKLNFLSYHYNGLKFPLHIYPAYYDEKNELWDYTEKIDRVQNDLLYLNKNKDDKLDKKVNEFCSKIPVENCAELKIYGLIPFENIIDIDKDGDIYHDYPHIFVNFDEEYGPFVGGYIKTLVVNGQGQNRFITVQSEKKRIVYFPNHF